MAGQRFRLKLATVATTEYGDRPCIVQLPQGAEIVVVDGIPAHRPAEASQQVAVRWRGRKFSMFVVDIEDRGERIQEAAPPGS